MTFSDGIGLAMLGWLVVRIEVIARLVYGHLRDHSKGTPLSVRR
jgi:hypothetical protein